MWIGIHFFFHGLLGTRLVGGTPGTTRLQRVWEVLCCVVLCCVVLCCVVLCCVVLCCVVAFKWLVLVVSKQLGEAGFVPKKAPRCCFFGSWQR